MFALNDKVVFPGHGIATITQITTKRVGASTITFYQLHFLNKDITILVPTHNFDNIGIRKLSSTTDIDQMFKVLQEQEGMRRSASLNSANWNKRSKEYQCKLRSGNLSEICEIYKDLKTIESNKELSFGERNLLQEAESLLAEEISVVRNVAQDQAIRQLRSML